MPGRDLRADIKRVMNILHESNLLLTILRYAQEGSCSPLMIEQAIELVDQHIAFAKEGNDRSGLATAEGLKAGLQEALKIGVQSLRWKKPPGPEITEVELPLFRYREALGHKVYRQRKCAGGVIDILDASANQLIECKHLGTSAALGAAAGQLIRYRPAFPDAEPCIAVLHIESEAQWLADVLRGQGIHFIEVEKL